MRKIVLAAALIASPMAAFAGGAGEPAIEPDVFVAAPAAAGSLGGGAGLLLGAVVLGAVALGSDSDSDTASGS